MSKKILLALFVLLIAYACTPFDSNKRNKELIQHTWRQVELVYPNQEGDSLITERPKGLTTLIFDTDTCIERLNDINTAIKYSYDIKDYVLKLEKDSANINYLDIQKLTSDSLILHINYRLLKYIKKAD